MFLPLPVRVTSKPPVLLPVNAAAWFDDVVRQSPPYTTVKKSPVFEA